jgi:hypothetical protein
MQLAIALPKVRLLRFSSISFETDLRLSLFQDCQKMAREQTLWKQ